MSVTGKRFDPDALAALEEERTFLLTSLRDLDAELAAGDIDRADYDELRDDYTRRTASSNPSGSRCVSPTRTLSATRTWRPTTCRSR